MLEHNEFYLHLIRHGQSERNVQPDLMGQTADCQLTEKGRNQAKLLGKRLMNENIDYVFSSHYTRAFDTATIAIGDKCPIIVNEDLREYEAGDWTNSSRSATLNIPTILRMSAMTHGFRPPNGESIHMVERRASKWLEDNILYNKNMIEQSVQKARPLNIFVFSHGVTIKSLLHYVMGFDQSFTWKLTTENTSISKLYFGQEGWRLITINDHAHLL